MMTAAAPARAVARAHARAVDHDVLLSLDVVHVSAGAGFGHYSISTSRYYCALLVQRQRDLLLIAVLFLVLGVLHLFRVFQLVTRSWRAKALTFGFVIESPRRPAPVMVSTFVRRFPFVAVLRNKWAEYFGAYGKYGIFGPHYSRRLGFREAIDVPSHLVQACYMSWYLSPPICVGVASVLALELASPLLLQVLHARLKGYHQFLRRCDFILADVIIDTALGAVIPCYLIVRAMLPYLGAQDLNINYSETSYTQVVLLMEQLVAKSSLDLFTKTVPFVFNYWTLYVLSVHVTMLRRRSPAHNVIAVVPVGPQSADTKGPLLMPAPATELEEPPHRTKSSLSQILARSSSRIMRLLHACSACLGLAIFLTALLMSGLVIPRGPCAPGCALEYAPWVFTSCYCVVQEINCVARGIDGRDVSSHFAQDNQDGVAILVLNRCHELVITAQLHRFSNLVGLYIYSSDVRDWPATAALSSRHFHRLSSVVLVKTELPRIPDGLLIDLTPSLIDMEIIASSVPPMLPGNLHDAWAHISTLYIEHCGLDEFPSELLALPSIDQLSLAGNAISSVPPNMSATPVMQRARFLHLAMNPLTLLPSNVLTSRLLQLYVDFTEISSLVFPSPSSGTSVSAMATPMCKSNATIAPQVHCHGLLNGLFSYGVYPIDPRSQARHPRSMLPQMLETE
ncbi:hypothetical protein PINS_up011991 [Pythium insidiosum]|nr:hypothetical protein PINS_up011991 [Pythium insidiosum]